MRSIWIALGIVVLIGVFMTSMYNGLVGLDQNVKQLWSQVENQLQRRYDLIPNLVRTVKGYAAHEKEIFIDVAEARAKLAGAATINQKAQAASGLEGVLGRLLAIAENYPQLQASKNFRALQDELSGTENRLAVARMRYNEGVENYNRRAKSIPTVMFVGLFGFDREKAYFQVANDAVKKTPKVEF
ncbi:MAG: LemA family protein [Candidatus Margulisiibacteriota bacterium]|nr:LemA family protein [Candidatus Margulisiibacteriota bacterium]